MTPILLELPWMPSANNYYRRVGNKTLISASGRAYQRLVQLTVACLPDRPEPVACRLRLVVGLMPPDRRRRDVDNTLKSLIDALKNARLFLDDEQIDRIEVERLAVTPGGLVAVRIDEWPQREAAQ